MSLGLFALADGDAHNFYDFATFRDEVPTTAISF
jgi:hypothetical protein